MKRITIIVLLLTFLIPVLRAEDTTSAEQPKHRPKVGLVLSGGGAKGMSHIGALKIIEELGIPIDYVVGTSIGSIIGGIYALGYSADEMDSLVRAQDWNLLMKDQISRRDVSYMNKKEQDQFILTIPFMNRKMLSQEAEAGARTSGGLLKNMPSALVEGQNLNQLFTKLSVGYQDDVDFNTLPIPFACVAVDLNTKEEVVFHRGNIVTAIRSSMSIPGYFAPVPYGDKYLVDGGMLNNLPVDVVKKMGADYVITIDLHHFKKEKTDTQQTIPEMVSTMLSIMNGEKYQSGRAASDIIIEPNTSAYGVLAFDEKSVDALVDSGLVAAQRVMPQLQSLAEYLKTFPEEKRVRPPHAIDLSRDSVLISQMEIQGADARDMNWLLSKTEIGPGELVSGNDMDQAMSLFYNTKAFTKIDYSIAGKEGNYRLKIHFSPERLHQAGVGFRFDTEEMAAILLGINLNKHKLFGSKLDWAFKLSAQPYMSLNYGYTFHNLSQFNVGIKQQHVQVADINEGEVIRTMRYNSLSATTFYQFTGWKSADVKIGAGFDYFTELIDSGTPIAQHDWKGFLDWGIDNMDDSYFPKSGVQINFGGGAHYNGTFFYEGRINLKAAIPLGSKVMLIPQTYNRWLFHKDDEPYPLFYGNRVGGYMAGRYCEWQVPFVGMNDTHSTLDKMDIARIDLRINLFRQHYLTLMGNYMFEFNLDHWKLSEYEHRYGFAAGYAINTIVGPIQLIGHWSNINRSFGVYFSLGHNF